MIYYTRLNGQPLVQRAETSRNFMPSNKAKGLKSSFETLMKSLHSIYVSKLHNLKVKPLQFLEDTGLWVAPVFI